MSDNSAAPTGMMGELSPNTGLEHLREDDIIIPRIKLLQDLSPELQADDPAYIEGAKSGMLAIPQYSILSNTLTLVFGQYRKTWVEWAPREAQAGVVAVHTRPPSVVSDPANEIKETASFLGWVVADGEARLTQPLRVLLQCTGSQHRASRMILTYATSTRVNDAQGNKVTAPLPYNSYILGTERRSNKSGRWWGYTVMQGSYTETLLADDPESVREIVHGTQQLAQLASDAPMITDQGADEVPF